VSLELGQVMAGWPLGASLAAALAVQGVQAGRRRHALNEALHELRRPLQAIALAAPVGAAGQSAPIEAAMQLAARAVQRLELEVNGESLAPVLVPTPVRPLAAAAVSRWRARAAMAGSALAFEWTGGEAAVLGDRVAIAQALDNLLVNAIEHGGPAIVVEARVRDGRLRLRVADSGRGQRPRARRGGPVEPIARLRGRRRHGHGLRVVRRVAAEHGGSFQLRTGPRGSEAVLELALSIEGGER
jgi:signal transduction histidine kinase